MIEKFDRYTPVIHKSAMIHPSAVIIGRVNIGPDVNIWAGAVLRADVAQIKIGRGSNIQDNCVIHVDYELDTVVGEDVTVGHGAVLHGCTIEDGCLVGMNAVVLNHSLVRSESVVAAGALVPERKEFPEGVLVMGHPAKAVRELEDKDRARLRKSAEDYRKLAAMYGWPGV